jgi:excisionase family DNA binding protein
LTPTAAVKALGISHASLYPLLMRREIPSIRVGGLRRMPIAALQRYIDELLSAWRLSDTRRLTPVRRAVWD